MNAWKILVMGLCFLATAAIAWLFSRINMDVLATAWIVLATILLLALMTAFFTWVRRMPRGTRKRGILYGLLAGFFPGLAVLAYAWRQGQLRDAIYFLPIMLVVSGVVLLPLGLLAWQVSLLIMARNGSQNAEAEVSLLSRRAERWLAGSGGCCRTAAFLFGALVAVALNSGSGALHSHEE